MKCLGCAKPANRWELKTFGDYDWEKYVGLCDGCSRSYAVWATKQYGKIELTFVDNLSEKQPVTKDQK